MNNNIYKIALMASLMMPLASCSDFLDREPLTQPEASSFLSSKTNVENFINGLYINLPSFNPWGMGSRGEEKNSDNIISEQYDKRLNGEFNQFNGTADWQNGYQNLRKVNYFFNYYGVPENLEDADVLSMKGEAHFLRAYWQFFLLKKFGSVPVMDAFWDGNATVEGLQIPAKPRGEVAKFILSELETAKSLLHPRSKFKGLRINKEAALTLAMNVALYEGSWEKYHKDTDFAATDAEGNKVDESAYFFGEVIKYGDELFQSGINIYTGGDDANKPGDSYGKLFSEYDLSNIDEVLLWRKYSAEDGVYHSMNSNLRAGVVDTEGAAGVTQELVDTYLNADGTYIDKNKQAEQLKDFNKMFEGRDARLLQTIMHNGCYWSSPSEPNSKPMNIIEYSEEAKDAISAPKLSGEGNTRSITGYHIRLGINETFDGSKSQKGEMPAPIIRYSEALLAYAEAAEELGQCSPEVFNQTIGTLRRRAGINVEYTDFSKVKSDPWFSDFGYTLSPVMQEIRRERRTELALQGYRLDDLLRWRAGNLIAGKRGKGTYIGNSDTNLSTLMKAYSPADRVLIKNRLAIDDAGWADPMAGSLPQGYGFRTDRDYLLPIPPSEINLNKTLKQNPNW